MSDQVEIRNYFTGLATITEEEDEAAHQTLPSWVFNQPSVDHFGRIMDEMVWWHKKRWGEAALIPPEGETVPLTDSAAALKRFLMIEWNRHGKRLRTAGHARWAAQSALWDRIALHRLRFLGQRKWYAVATSADELRRRILVLAVPPQRGTPQEREEHARRQMTYNDTMEDLYEPGQRVSKALRELVSPQMREGLTRGFKVPHKYYPARHHGKNYGGVAEMPERAEEQLAKERGRFNEGPLLYTPHIVTDLNGIYYEEKDKFRLIWDCKKSSYNASNEEAGGDFTTLQEMLKSQRPDAWMAGFDQRDAFRLWALEQPESDLIGMYSAATNSYDRARYLVFGANYSPEIQGRNMKELMPIWDGHVNRVCPRGNRADGFETTAAWVDDGHIVLDGSMTKEEADEQFSAFLAFCDTHGLEVAPEKNVWPTKIKEYVGLEIDSVRQVARVGGKRIAKLVEAIDTALAGLEENAVVDRHISGDGKRSWSARLPPRPGERLLDLCGGIGTGVHALLEAGWKVDEHWLVESHGKTRRMAENYRQMLEEKYPGRLRQGESERGALPHDVTKITERHIRALGKITVLMCAWPCQGFSGASRKGRGLRDERSGIFWDCVRVLQWVKKYNPEVRFLFENVDFSNSENPRLRREYQTVGNVLGVAPVVADAAHVSGAHRVRSYWASWKITRDLSKESGPTLQSLLDDDHLVPVCTMDDFPPQARFNKKGQPRLKYVTVMRSEDTYSTRNGKALVYNKLTGKHELPRVQEMERIVGLLDGATAGKGVSEKERRAACGNVIDRRMLSWLLRDMPEAEKPEESRQLERDAVADAQPFRLGQAQRLDWAALIGKLQHCAPVVPGGQAHLAASYASRDDFVSREVGDWTLRRQWGASVGVHISETAISELKWWRQSLLSNPERRYYCTGDKQTSGFWTGETRSSVSELADKRVHVTAEGVLICRTDAAGKAGGAAWGHRRLIHPFRRADCAPTRSSNWRELAMVLEAVKHWQKEWSGQRVLIMCDNSTACSIVRRQGTTNPELNKLYEEMQRICTAQGIDLALRHIKGADNVLADALSRYERGVDYSDWMYDPAEFAWVERAVQTQHTVDACCDPMGNNKHAPIFYSALDDCVEYDWGGQDTWCNADYNQLTRILRHFRRCRQSSPTSTAATFCVPVWDTKPWWRLLKGAEVVALYPKGEQLFTAPDWAKLRRSDGSMGLGSVRKLINPTKWDVLTIRFPSRSSGRSSGRGAGARGPRGLCDGRGMHVLSGDPLRDAAILSGVRALPLQRLHGGSPRAHRPDWTMSAMPHARGAEAPNHQQEKSSARTGQNGSKMGGEIPPESNQGVATARTRRPGEIRRQDRGIDFPHGGREPGSEVHNLVDNDARTSSGRVDGKKLLSRCVGGARIPAECAEASRVVKPDAYCSRPKAAPGRDERVQEAVQSEAPLDHSGIPAHAATGLQCEHPFRKTPEVGAVDAHVGRRSERSRGPASHQIPSDQGRPGATDGTLGVRQSCARLRRQENAVHTHRCFPGQECGSMEAPNHICAAENSSVEASPRARTRKLHYQRAAAVRRLPVSGTAREIRLACDAVRQPRCSLQEGVRDSARAPGRSARGKKIRFTIVPEVDGAVAVGRRLGQARHRRPRRLGAPERRSGHLLQDGAREDAVGHLAHRSRSPGTAEGADKGSSGASGRDAPGAQQRRSSGRRQVKEIISRRDGWDQGAKRSVPAVDAQHPRRGGWAPPAGAAWPPEGRKVSPKIDLQISDKVLNKVQRERTARLGCFSQFQTLA